MPNLTQSRKTFLRRLWTALCAVTISPLAACRGAEPVEPTPSPSPTTAPSSPAVTPTRHYPVTSDARKAAFAKVWVERMMNCLDQTVDEETRRTLMTRCGQACFLRAHGAAEQRSTPPTLEDLDDFIARAQAYLGKENVYREGRQVHFAYVQNPAGLRVADGFCLCPIVEDGPKVLSPTYCLCSQGYVKEMFDRTSPQPVTVELLESVRTGGAACRFLIHLNL